ncbi:MAG: TolC family protein [Aquificaceae bacterium]|nr:TolC family protein [Aquificaceae bacterium]
MRHFLLLFLLSLSFGQEVLLLDPRKVYELALKNNKELQKLEHQIKALEIDYQLAQKYYLPVVYAGASLLYDMDKKNIRTEGSLTVISTLYELQKTRSRIELSKIRRDIAHVMLQQLHRDLQLKILKLFSDAQIYRKLAEVKREEMAIAYVRFDRARERKELGLATEHEVLKLESLYREKRSELLQAQHLYNHTLLEVKNLAGISLETIIQLKELDFREPERQVLDFSQLREEILRENSGLKIKDMEIRMYEEDIKLARQVVMPRVNLRISTNKSGLELSTPIYDAGRGYKIDYLLSFKRSAQSERENLEQSLRLISLSAPYEWEFLRAKLVEAYAKDRFAEENLTLRRSEYELELAFDLGYAMAEKSEAERQLMEARYKLLLFWARLFSIAGREPFSLLE